MSIPIASTVTLVMEMIVGALIYLILYRGYVRNIFPSKLAFFAIGYEIVFNVGYMLYRTISVPSTAHLSPTLKMVAALHGILSLIMLIVVVVFFLRATKGYAQKINYFAVHKVKTFLFVFFWTISLLSGIFLYFKVYF